MKDWVRFISEASKELIAFALSFFSISLGMGAILIAFEIAAQISDHLILAVPALVVGLLVPVLLVVIPRYLYRWRYGFPAVPPRHRSPRLDKLRRAAPF